MLFKASFDVYYFTINVPFINNGCYISVTNQCKGFSDSVHSLCCEGFSKIHHPAFFIVWRDASFADKLVSQTKALAHRAALITEDDTYQSMLNLYGAGKRCENHMLRWDCMTEMPQGTETTCAEPSLSTRAVA